MVKRIFIAVLFYLLFLAGITVVYSKAGEYTDINGYFSFSPPGDWRFQDFSIGKRTKVIFRSPDGKAKIGIVVRKEEENFEELKAEKEEYVKDHQRLYPKGTFAVSEVKICRVRAIRVDYEVPRALKEEQYFFTAAYLQFNLTYGTADAEDFSKYRDEALTALNSLEIINKEEEEKK